MSEQKQHNHGFSDFDKLFEISSDGAHLINKFDRLFNPKGSVAGRINDHGYLKVWAFKRNWLVHRILFLLRNKEWPKKFLDHKNGIRTDNRAENLREASASENKCNCSHYKKSATKYKGIHFLKDSLKWRVVIMKNYQSFHIGYFKNLDDAILSRNEALKKLHGEFVNLT